MVDDVNANIGVNIDTSSALASLKVLQRQISLFHTQMAAGGATANAQAAKLQSSLLNAVSATGQFQASMTRVNSTTEAFTTALEKNKLSMGQYFRYAGGASKTFGRAFKSEFDTISKVAVERVKDLQTQYISMGRDANGALQAIKIRPLALDMDNLATKTMIAAQKQQLFNQLLTQGSTNLLNFGKNTQWAGRQLMVGFTIPLTMFATAAAKSFMDIEKQVIKIRRVYGDFSTTVEETDKMVDSIKSLATEYTKYGIAVKDTISLAAEAAAAGKTGQELLAQVSEATRLAVLGNVEQSQALETTMSITNAFGTATEDLASKIDFLNAVENQSVTSIEDLTEAIPKAGPVVQQLGGDVEDLAFFLTAMKEGGINASEGANALKSGLAALINPTGKAKEMLQGFGINIEQIVESNKGDIKGLVIDFASALDTLDPLNRARAIEQLFGKFQFSRLSTLFQNVIGEGTQASRVLELTKATTQELAVLSQRELKKVEDTTTYKFEKAFADFQAALAPVGESFLKVVTPILEFGTKLLEQFNSMGDGAKNFTIILTTVVAGIGPVLLMTVGLVANGVANLIKMFQLLGGIFKKTGVDTGILGTQTDYMTQQQIEAAAVAASLNQSHSRLTQTFSVEAAALNSLTAAYQKAITAQRGFSGAGAVPRSSTRPKKYAKGVVSVPGPKGKGDVVPAMLAPGEAVIPAAMAKKYGGLINAMVAGKIPGYEQGLNAPEDWNLSEAGIRGRSSIQGSFSSIIKKGYEAELKQVIRSLDGLKVSTRQAQQIFSHMNAAATGGTKQLTSWIAALKENATLTSSTSQLIKTQKETTGVAKGVMGGGSFAHLGSGASMSAREYVEKYGVDKLDARTRKRIETLMDKDPDKKDSVSIKSGLGLGGFSQSINEQMRKSGASTKDFLSAFKSAGVEKWNDSIRIGGGNVEELAASTAKLNKRFEEIIKNSGAEKVFDTRAQAATYMAANQGVKAISTEEVYAIARKDADAELRKVLDKAQRTATGVRAGSVTSQETSGRRAGGLSRPELDRELERTAARENRVSKKEEETAATRSKTAKEEEKTSRAKSREVKTKSAQQQTSKGTRVVQSGDRYYSVDSETGTKTRLSNDQGRAAIAAEEKRLAKNAAQRERRALAKQATTPSAPKQGIGSRIASGVRGGMARIGPMGGMMAVGAVGAGVSMIPGMEALGTGIATIGPLMMMLPGPIAAVVGGLSLMAGIIMATNAAQEESRKKAVALGEATVLSTASVIKMSESFGTVTASETIQAAQASAITSTSTEALSAGQQYFREDVVGQSILANAQTATKEMSDPEFIDSIANNFAYAVAQGTMPADMAKDYVAALAVELGRADLAVGLKAEITDLIGDAADPAAATDKIIQSSLDQARSTLDAAEAKTVRTAGKGGVMTTIDTAGYQQGTTELLNTYSQAVGSNDIIEAQFGGQIQALIDKQKELKVGSQEYLALGQQISTLESERVTALEANRVKQSEIYAELENLRATLGEAEFNKIIEVKIKETYGEDGTSFLDELKQYDGSEDFKIGITAALSSGAMNLATAQGLLDSAIENKALETIYTVTLKENGLQAAINKANALRSIIADAQRGFMITADNADRILRNAGNVQPYTPAPVPTTTTPAGGGDGGDGGGGGGGGGGTPEDSILADLNKQKDKEQKALNVINLKEDAINKIYDKRKKTLEQIARINSNIADKQKTQLTIAGALASGDIAAAARAVQESRAKASSYAQEEQMRALEAKRQAELDGIIVNGKTKEAYEAEIAKLNLKIAERELALATGAATSGGGSGGGSGRGNTGSKTPSTVPETIPETVPTTTPTTPAKPLPVVADRLSGTTPTAPPKPPVWVVTARAQVADFNTKMRLAQVYIDQQRKIYNDALAKSKDPAAGKVGRSDAAELARVTQPKILGGMSKLAEHTRNRDAARARLSAAGYANGGLVAQRYAFGGAVGMPRFKNPSLGSDSIPAMLTPGEFVVKRPAVKNFGVKGLEKINNGQSPSGSVYNYNVNLNVSSVSNPDEIARTVITKIKDIDKQRIRGNSY